MHVEIVAISLILGSVSVIADPQGLRQSLIPNPQGREGQRDWQAWQAA